MKPQEEFEKALSQQEKLQSVYNCAAQGKYLYHYATRKTFWSILESDLLFARHIRFSNDSVEYEIGKDKIRDFMKLQNKDLANMPMDEINHCYMICFCGSNDLLSQWRGYANEGVAIGMDFSIGAITSKDGITYERSGLTYCSVMDNEETLKAIKEGDSTKKESVVKVTAPYQVQYVDGNKELEETEENKKLLDKLTNIYDEIEEDARQQQLIRYIPYIKDVNFKEEEEYRLILNLQSLGNSFAHSSAVRSTKVFYVDVNGIKKPTIKVRFGNAEETDKPVKFIYISSAVSEHLKGKINNDLEKNVSKPDVLECVCYDSDEDEIIIGDGCNQAEVFEQLEIILESENAQTKVWCDGHLPIREITVGPSWNQKNMIESIRNYICDKYWLKYVEVNGSKIPLRSN